MISCTTSTVVMNYNSTVDIFCLDSGTTFATCCDESQHRTRRWIDLNTRRSPTPCWMTFKSSGLPNSGARAQHLLLMSSAKSRFTSPLQSLSTRQPPRMTPPPGFRGNMYVVSLFTLCGERKYILVIGVFGFSTSMTCPYIG